jgi:hypothetical protein
MHNITHAFLSIDPSALDHITGGNGSPSPGGTHRLGDIFRRWREDADRERDDHREAHGRDVSTR